MKSNQTSPRFKKSTEETPHADVVTYSFANNEGDKDEDKEEFMESNLRTPRHETTYDYWNQ